MTIGGKNSVAEQELQWKAPPMNWVKLNTDGAYSHFGSGFACGGVIRDAHRNFLKGFIFKGLDGDSLVAELWGCLNGLKLAWDLGYRQVLLESDSVEAIELMRKEPNELHEDQRLIAEIHGLMERDWRFEVAHISRRVNNVADYLAKAGLSVMPSLHVVSSADEDLERILAKDKG